MKVTVFGATGGTGKHVVRLALAAGHDVTAVARNPATVPAGRDRLSVIQGDALDSAAVEQAVAGSDAIVSALGSPGRKPTTVYSQGVSNMLQAMKAHGPRRIIALSADGVEPNPNVNIGQRLVTQFIVAQLFRYQWSDMLVMERTLAGSDVDWTVVRLPRLRDSGYTAKYRVATGQPIKDSSTVSRASVADYIVTHLDDPASYQQTVWLSS